MPGNQPEMIQIPNVNAVSKTLSSSIIPKNTRGNKGKENAAPIANASKTFENRELAPKKELQPKREPGLAGIKS